MTHAVKLTIAALAAAIVLLCGFPPAAGASRLSRDPDTGAWRTLGTNHFTLFVDPNVPPFLAASTREAAMEWGNDVDPILVDETADPAQANVIVNVGDCKINGQDNYACYGYGGRGKTDTISFDTSLIGAPTLKLKLRGFYVGLACTELGHVLGLDHGGQGCLQLWPLGQHTPTLTFHQSLLLDLLRHHHDLFHRVGPELTHGYTVSNSKPGLDDVLLLDRMYTP